MRRKGSKTHTEKVDLLLEQQDAIMCKLGQIEKHGEMFMAINAGLVEATVAVEGAAESALFVFGEFVKELADAKAKMGDPADAAIVEDVIARLQAVKGKLAAAVPVNDPVPVVVGEAAAAAAAEAAAKAVQDQLDAEAAATAVEAAAKEAADAAAADAAAAVEEAFDEVEEDDEADAIVG